MKEIPEMTNPLGRYWDQPDRSKIIIDDKYAIMTEQTMNELKEYSTTNPSGVYEGKMWRSKFVENGKTIHYLHWYSNSEKPNYCKHNVRNILIT